eukprot:1160688-Pelagomonas_calceolata.AAC.9
MESLGLTHSSLAQVLGSAPGLPLEEWVHATRGGDACNRGGENWTPPADWDVGVLASKPAGRMKRWCKEGLLELNIRLQLSKRVIAPGCAGCCPCSRLLPEITRQIWSSGRPLSKRFSWKAVREHIACHHGKDRGQRFQQSTSSSCPFKQTWCKNEHGASHRALLNHQRI